MTKDQMEAQLKGVLKRLEATSDGIIKTRGYTNEAEKIRMLEEMIKEQLRNENTRSSTR